MEFFIRNEQYNFIKEQTRILVNGHSTVRDPGVLKALNSLAKEKVLQQFPELNDQQRQLIEPISYIKTIEMAASYLEDLKPYVIPFAGLSEKAISKLFPKTKKLKIPDLEQIDLAEISYLGWNDSGTNRKYLVVESAGSLTGIEGNFKNSSKKGICAICNKHQDIGMFTAKAKGSGETYVKKGNYICQDSMSCNERIESREKLENFISRIIH